MNDLVPLNKRGTRAVGMTAGGVGLMILGVVAHGFLPALIAGGVVFLIGAAVGSSKDKGDKNVGLGIMGAGVLAAVAGIPFLGGLASWLLGTAGIGLLAYGVFNIFKFVKGLRNKA
jgi:hypothetical protein